ncbi:MAG: YjbH domain-containing protein [Sulfuricurvum sp.]|jgi:hypothetical protein|uniref:YjbH domain-containing protein n=1 Tax=Sulfuricurvum sp. TaxID=2025608 RepID=UPI0025DA1F87|nr:YjbH domain-containing protein [Sulfuricurvum sp.]MCK9372298.1 YjbH domain-containing protein [Sulfuricurvum sp.]
MVKVRLVLSLFVSISCFAEVRIPSNQNNNDYSIQNSGKTGLIEMPNARVMDDWRMRPSIYYSDPYIYYGIAMAPLPRTEINFRVTQLKNLNATGEWAGYGNYKDKAIDMKFLLSKEDDFWPAVAIGFDDMQGTGLYSSKYLVGTKRLDYLEFSGGYALGRMGGENLNKYGKAVEEDRAINFLTDTSISGGALFGGVEAHMSPKWSIKAEYSPINYNYDYVNPFANAASSWNGTSKLPRSRINIGTKYKISDKLALTANFERGNTIGFGLSYTIPFRQEMLYDHGPDRKWRADQSLKEKLKVMNDEELSKAIAEEIAGERFSNVQVAVNENKIWASIENPRYNSDTQALGRTADVIDEVAPERIDDLYLTLKQTNLEYSVMHVHRHDVKAIKTDENGSINEKGFDFSDDVEASYGEFSGGKELFITEPIAGKKFTWLFKPSIQMNLNDKHNPFTYKFSLLGGARYETNPGGFLYSRYIFPITNTTDTIPPYSYEPEGSTTRTDGLKYLQYNGIQLYDMVFDQTVKLPWNIYGRGEIGYFEPAYGGYDVEVYRPFDGGRFGAGLEYQYAKKRSITNFFTFENTVYQGKFINLYANIVPELGIKSTAKIGEFFAGDRGVSVTLMREFKNFTLGAFVTKTDTSVFSSAENRGYVDKGIFLRIPLSTVRAKNVKGSLSYTLNPWTRDVGQYANQANSLVGLNPANVFEMREKIDQFKE